MIATMTLGLSLAFLLAFFVLLTTIGISIARYAFYNHYEAGVALRFAVFSADQEAVETGADIDPVTGVPAIASDNVAPYFLYAYQKVLGVSCTSIPGQCTGAKQSIYLDGLDYYSPGSLLPNGLVTNQPGFLISLHIPMFSNGLFSNLHLGQNSTINMSQFVPEQPAPAAAQ